MITGLSLALTITGLIINLYTLYTIRLALGHLANQALEKAKEVIKK